jgi:tripartite-type tricarboxylate transporter receptor subunit TctC
MKKITWVSAAVVFVVFLLSAIGSNARANGYYEGKTITFVVGFATGGGYDTFTRAVARHFGKHVPGNPTTVVENRTGAGSLIAANYVYNKAKPDGLTVGAFGSGLVTQQALGARGIRFDAPKFGWIGSMSVGTPVCAVMGFTGLTTLKDVLASKKTLKIGSTGPGATSDDLPKLMIGLMDAPFDVIRGYKGTSQVRVAMQRRELDGACWTWESMRTTARAMLDARGDDRLIPYIIEGGYDDPLVKDLPQFTQVIDDKENLAAFKAWLNPYKFFRPLALPPDAPADRLKILRTALQNTMEDPAFIGDAKKSKLDATYTSGEEIDRLVQEILSLPGGAKNKLQSLLASGK